MMKLRYVLLDHVIDIYVFICICTGQPFCIYIYIYIYNGIYNDTMGNYRETTCMPYFSIDYAYIKSRLIKQVKSLKSNKKYLNACLNQVFHSYFRNSFVVFCIIAWRN